MPPLPFPCIPKFRASFAGTHQRIEIITDWRAMATPAHAKLKRNYPK